MARQCRLCEVIRGQIAETIWVTAWADYEEEYNNGEGLRGAAGQDITQFAPSIPYAAYRIADAFIAEFVRRQGGRSIALLFQQFALEVSRAGSSNNVPLTPVRFGHYLVMEAEGHGVGLWEWVDHKLNIPSLENVFLFQNEQGLPEFDYIEIGADK